MPHPPCLRRLVRWIRPTQVWTAVPLEPLKLMHEPQLDDYSREYPLSERWTRPSLCQHVARVAGIDIHLVGLTTVDASGQGVTGSAGSLEGMPLDRAYFELMERTSIVEALAGEEERLAVFNARGERDGTAPRRVVFSQSCEERRFVYARSNGVALGRDWESAARRAELELIERDGVLRSWYGGEAPNRVRLPQQLVPDSLDELYVFEAYVVPERRDSGKDVEVTALFGFPRVPDAPLVYGFGAREDQCQSLVVAAGECLQRLGFLWGERLPAGPPTFAPTPDYHQEFYLYPPNHARIRDWLGGGHEAFRGLVRETTAESSARRFVDLTPPALRSKVVVVKALPADELLLTFGQGHPALRAPPPEQLAIHPIA
ncbi:MAG: YcaO-like family protein [Polyangiaceae bacterium]|nr:YcaO-like family protein [Polyangiaceae bacterium]